MRVFCDNCMGENEIDESLLVQNGYRAACTICGHMIFIDSEEIQAINLRKKLKHKATRLDPPTDSRKQDDEPVQETDIFGSVSQSNLTTTVAADIELPETYTSPARLVVIEGQDAGLEIPMEIPRLVIGRRGADVNLNDRLVSRRHAAIEAGSGRYLLKDLGSTNGTFLNGQPAGMEFLKHGDEIQLGSTLIRFTIRGMESSIVVLS
ncbi:FHA domain-containing protein [bacterium]|nr:FHA domain-containing protein [candidate division CSSED10-310 bacterium]